MKAEKFLEQLGLSVNIVIVILLLVIVYYLYCINDNLSMERFSIGGQEDIPLQDVDCDNMHQRHDAGFLMGISGKGPCLAAQAQALREASATAENPASTLSPVAAQAISNQHDATDASQARRNKKAAAVTAAQQEEQNRKDQLRAEREAKEASEAAGLQQRQQKVQNFASQQQLDRAGARTPEEAAAYRAKYGSGPTNEQLRAGANAAAAAAAAAGANGGAGSGGGNR